MPCQQQEGRTVVKNIVVYSDGTGQDGGVRIEQRFSNIWKMYRASRTGFDSAIDPREQVVFYDPGLGTESSKTALSSPIRVLQKLLASATGRGITTNIADCYEFIINHYEPGDRIYLFGFSRGAYTARCIANLLMLCGVPVSAGGQPVLKFRKATRDIAEEAVLEVFEHGAGQQRAAFEGERNEKARRFRLKYGSAHQDTDQASNAAPYFIGVFDTVAALGASGPLRFVIGAALVIGGLITAAAAAGVVAGLSPWRFAPTFVVVVLAATIWGLWTWLRPALKVIRDYPNPGDPARWHFAIWKADNFDRLLSRHVGYARHAMALDETREPFDRVPWGSAGMLRPHAEGQPDQLQQVWFAGNHSDIGGSYPETESRLSDIALDWMISEVRSIPHPLLLENSLIRRFPAADGIQHCEVAGMQDTIVRKLGQWAVPWLGWKEKVREVKDDARVDPLVLTRFDLPIAPKCTGAGSYRPAALRKHQNFARFYD
jgi:uncharacterized protein (DUF2235 family)